MRGDVSRRTMLRAGAATAGLGTLGSLAGCSSFPFLGGGGSYRTWLPEPGSIRGTDHYPFTYLDTKTVVNNEDSFDDERFEAIERMAREFREPLDVDFDETNWILTFGGMAVLDAEFDSEDVADDLDDMDFDDDEYKNYTIYISPSGNRAVGVNGSTLVFTRSTGEDDAEENLELLIDTNKGEEARYTTESDDFGELVSKLGDGTAVSGATVGDSFFEEVVAAGGRINVNGDTSKLAIALVFEDASDAETDADSVETVIESLEDDTDAEDLTANKNGRTVLISGVVDTDELGAAALTGSPF